MTLEMTLPRLKPKPLPKRPLARWLWENRWTVTELADALGEDKGAISRIATAGQCSERLAEKVKRATGLSALR